MTIAQQLKIKDFPFVIKDNQGNYVYYECSYGYWEKSEFDDQGNDVYYENSEGYWEKSEYNDQGNRVYYEDSDGNWEKSEFDDQGNLVYWKNSDGEIENNRPQQNCEGKIVEINGKKYKLKLLK